MALIATSFRNPLGDGILIDSSTPNNGGYFNAQEFGANNHLGEDWNRLIPGMGVNGDEGEPVYSIANGVVVRVSLPGDETTGWGNSIIIKHTLTDGSVVYSQYNHMKTGSVSLSVGDSVLYGQAIGQIGNTGNSTAAHLHFEIKDFSTFGVGYSSVSTGFYDPSDFINLRRDISGSTTTAAELQIGTSQRSAVEVSGDSDWFKVYLQAGKHYSFAVRGNESGNGNLVDPMLRLRSPAGTLLSTNDNGGGTRDARISSFAASESGYYYVTAYSAGTGTGSYSISAVESAAPQQDNGAQLVSNGFLDLRELNFSFFNQLDNFEFFDNANPSFDSSEIPGLVGTYSASDLIAVWNGVVSFEDALLRVAGGGENIVLDQNLNPVSGTLTGLVMSEAPEPGVFNYFAFAGFSVSLVTLFNASLTETIADDQAVLQTMLSGSDRIVGSTFADYAFAGNGNDNLLGNQGDDTLLGDAGNDQLNGGDGNDSLRGGSGNDALTGGVGNDLIYADTGSDRLTGGQGTDRLYGGTDSLKDVFVFASYLESANSSARDVIFNFSAGVDDISLTAIDANTGAGGNQNFVYGGTTAAANSVWHVTTSGNTLVYSDVTGDGVADFSIRLTGVTGLSASDFLL